MAERKIFAGPRVRRIRNGLGLTQTAMAEALEISPSYLNLIERNQRPLTVQLLLKLASVYKVDLDELQGEAGGSTSQLREVFAEHHGKPARSFPARLPALRLDRIYVRNLKANRPQVLSTRPWSHLSDHAPLSVEIEL